MVGLKLNLFNRYNEPVIIESVGRCKYKLTFDGSFGITLGADKSIEAIDPSGGPFIGVGSNLNEYVLGKKSRRNLVVDKIKRENKEYVIYTRKL